MLIAFQGLYWSYTSEVIAILGAELAIFCVATQLPVHTVKTAFAVLAIYPLTILVVGAALSEIVVASCVMSCVQSSECFFLPQ